MTVGRLAQFENVKACVFDAYGTLFDVHSAVRNGGQILGDKAGAVSELWRTKQLEYTWLRSLMGAHVDFWQVTSDGLDFALAAAGVENKELHDALMNLYLSLDAYEEVKGTLGVLKKGGLQTAILSNGSPTMLEAAVRSADLKDVLDANLSVEEVGIFKPDARGCALRVQSRLDQPLRPRDRTPAGRLGDDHPPSRPAPPAARAGSLNQDRTAPP